MLDLIKTIKFIENRGKKVQTKNVVAFNYRIYQSDNKY